MNAPPTGDDPGHWLDWLAAQLQVSPARVRATVAWARFRPSNDSLDVVELVLAVEDELFSGAGGAA